jgi:hypothetical protein
VGVELAASTRSISYERWTSLLGEHFFRPEYGGTHVMYFVDDGCLASVTGMKEPDAVASLRLALESRLAMQRPRRLFAPIARESRDWWRAGADGLPPCLPLLAFAVLAATRMARAADRAGTNYYLPFCELLALDIDPSDIYASYGYDVPTLWKLLRRWLDEKHRGALGFSTIEARPGFSRMGWADSQTLFASSDRDKLTQFFQWMEYEPGTDTDERELLLYFRRWAVWRDDLNPGTQAMLEDDAFPQQLGEILLHAARTWEGVVRDEEGRPTGELSLTFEVAPTPQLGLAARRPRGFPEELTFKVSPGREMRLSVDDSGLEEADQWYAGLDLSVTGAMLESGLTLRAGEYLLRLPPYQLHILQKSQDLGCWASQRLLRPDEPAWLLVRSQSLERLLTYLRHARVDGWHVVDREGIVPRGWHLIRDVQLPADVREPPEGLARLKPRATVRMGLVGGLALVPAREYLTGGEPDLQLPAEDTSEGSREQAEVEVELDGVTRSVRDGLLRLRGDLDPGLHEVRLEGVPRKFVTKDTLGLPRPAVQRPIRHLLRQSAAECSAVTFGASANRQAGSSVDVSGAAISGAEIAPVEPPIVLPAAALSITMVGPQPGQIATISPPSAPPWVEELNKAQPDLWLGYRVFEFQPHFPVTWLRCNYHLGPTTRLRACLAPDTQGAGDEGGIRDWIAFFAGKEPPTGDLELWAAYVAVARGLES